MRPRNLPTDEQLAVTHPELVAEKRNLMAIRTPTDEARAEWNAMCADFNRRWQAAGLPEGVSLVLRDAQSYHN